MDSSLKVVPLDRTQLDALANYWDNLSDDELLAMGALRSNIPNRNQFLEKISHQIQLADQEKDAFAMIAFLNSEAVGHCNLNPVQYGKEGKMHLHVWNSKNRAKGLGKLMVEQSVPIFFDRFQLSKIICEPLAENIGPNKVLEKAGFTRIKKYITIPSPHCFEQEVNRWEVRNS